jgi:UDP-N-acetylmuramate--alanine ligase
LRGLSRRRDADRGRDEPRARALDRKLGKARPFLVEDVAQVEAAVRAHAKDGDVVVTMGAGSIGNVPAQLAAGQR